MSKHELMRLGFILGVALICIWGLEMLDRPRLTEVVVREGGAAEGALVTKLQRERDSLIVLLAEARGEDPPQGKGTSVSFPYGSPLAGNTNLSSEEKPTTRSLELAGELRRTAGQNRLLGIAFYDRSLREKLPEASFTSAQERTEIKAKIEVLREINKARSACNFGEPAGCNKLEYLYRDSRLSPEQREMVRLLMKKS
jgi:hypothetical protein